MPHIPFYTTLTSLIAMFLGVIGQQNRNFIQLLCKFQSSLALEELGHSIACHVEETERIISVCLTLIQIAKTV
jgi:hypothetical protein